MLAGEVVGQDGGDVEETELAIRHGSVLGLTVFKEYGVRVETLFALELKCRAQRTQGEFKVAHVIGRQFNLN